MDGLIELLAADVTVSATARPSHRGGIPSLAATRSLGSCSAWDAIARARRHMRRTEVNGKPGAMLTRSARYRT